MEPSFFCQLTQKTDGGRKKVMHDAFMILKLGRLMQHPPHLRENFQQLAERPMQQFSSKARHEKLPLRQQHGALEAEPFGSHFGIFDA